MNILVISNYGEYHSVRPEAEIFMGLKERGHDITIITPLPSPYEKEFKKAGIKVKGFHPSGRYDKPSIASIRAELLSGDYDILHLFNNYAITNGLAAALGLSVKIVIYRGAAQHMEWYNPVNYVKFFHPRIDAVVCNSQEIKEIYDKNPFTRMKTSYIPKGHRTEWYESTPEIDIHKELLIPEGEMICVTVANNRKVKGIPQLLQAVNRLPKGIKMNFLLIGKNMDTPEIIALIDNSPHKSRIHILGFKPDAISYTKSADLLILPSLGSESLNKSVIEAMSLGTPALITDLAGNLPLVDHGKNGYIVKTGDVESLKNGLIQAYENRDGLSTMGKEAKQKIDSDIHISKTIDLYEDFYDGLIKA